MSLTPTLTAARPARAPSMSPASPPARPAPRPLAATLAGTIAAILVSGATPARAQDSADLDMINRIRAEGFERSHVMEILRHITDDLGPRLTASPQKRRANEWALKQLTEWKLANAHLEGFEFGRGWSFSHASVHMLAPHQVPLTALPKAWSPGTSGPVSGEVMAVDIETTDDLARFRGKVRGKVLFVDESVRFDPPDRPFRRLSRDELGDLATFPIEQPGGGQWRRRRLKEWKLRKALNQFLATEQPLALVSISSRDANLVRVMGYTYKVGETTPVPELVMAAEHYNRVMRMLDAGQEVTLEIDVRAQFHDDDTKAYNVIAEIPGTSRRNEVVMLGAHFDSWHGGTGAVDNGAGCAVVMEAVRILTSLKVRPRRTIRIALWSGEEQGLLGSQAYVEQHFADRPEPADPEQRALPRWLREDRGWPLRRKPEHRQVAAYFNLDNGSGRIRGIYAEGNSAVKPIFESWLRPFHDLDADAVTLRGTGGTDHLSFQAVGLPGFQFVQDGLDYFSRLHHTNIDVLDHVQEKDLMQASVIMASFVYHAAMRPRMLPRLPVPTAPTEWEKQRRDKLRKDADRARDRRHRRER